MKAEMEKVKKAMADMEQDWKKRLLEAKRCQLSEAERQALAVPADQRNAEQSA